MSTEWLVLAFLAAAGWLWWDGRQKYELAMAAARQVCQHAGVQLLDETVALRSMRLARDEDQRVRIQREFAFEYSSSGDNRLPGRVFLLGATVMDSHLLMPAQQ